MEPLEGVRMPDLPDIIKTVQRGSAKAYHEGELAERRRNLDEMKRIVGFKEYEARVALTDYITHLEKQE